MDAMFAQINEHMQKQTKYMKKQSKTISELEAKIQSLT
jgi:hypothetical protein